ncbi:rhodanese-like domain-containing protein [Alteromonas facilis]|uniref:rhodanese-like domain-containing protein n=1 Tax=Alteromonas facilis TaxID=2048004 RepID=UPI000C28FFC7|nr:rhodanese-like domain-containing protein [Alteromonas facilis]
MIKWLVTFISTLSFSISAAEIPGITAETLLSSDTTEWLILDVRSAEEYAEGHVPGAINIAHSDLADELAKIGEFKDKTVVLYCRSGKRAGKAAEVLLEANFSDLRHLEGDMLGWREAGHGLAY